MPQPIYGFDADCALTPDGLLTSAFKEWLVAVQKLLPRPHLLIKTPYNTEARNYEEMRRYNCLVTLCTKHHLTPLVYAKSGAEFGFRHNDVLSFKNFCDLRFVGAAGSELFQFVERHGARVYHVRNNDFGVSPKDLRDFKNLIVAQSAATIISFNLDLDRTTVGKDGELTHFASEQLRDLIDFCKEQERKIQFRIITSRSETEDQKGIYSASCVAAKLEKLLGIVIAREKIFYTKEQSPEKGQVIKNNPHPDAIGRVLEVLIDDNLISLESARRVGAYVLYSEEGAFFPSEEAARFLKETAPISPSASTVSRDPQSPAPSLFSSPSSGSQKRFSFAGALVLDESGIGHSCDSDSENEDALAPPESTATVHRLTIDSSVIAEGSWFGGVRSPASLFEQKEACRSGSRSSVSYVSVGHKH